MQDNMEILSWRTYNESLWVYCFKQINKGACYIKVDSCLPIN